MAPRPNEEGLGGLYRSPNATPLPKVPAVPPASETGKVLAVAPVVDAAVVPGGWPEGEGTRWVRSHPERCIRDLLARRKVPKSCLEEAGAPATQPLVDSLVSVQGKEIGRRSPTIRAGVESIVRRKPWHKGTMGFGYKDFAPAWEMRRTGTSAPRALAAVSTVPRELLKPREEGGEPPEEGRVTEVGAEAMRPASWENARTGSGPPDPLSLRAAERPRVRVLREDMAPPGRVRIPPVQHLLVPKHAFSPTAAVPPKDLADPSGVGGPGKGS